MISIIPMLATAWLEGLFVAVLAVAGWLVAKRILSLSATSACPLDPLEEDASIDWGKPEPGEAWLTIGDQFQLKSPAAGDIAQSLAALQNTPNTFLFLTTQDGVLQTFVTQDGGFVLEIIDGDSEQLLRATRQLTLNEIVQALQEFALGAHTWKNRYDWEMVVDLEVEHPETVCLGQFEPRDARRLSNALEEAGIDYEPEQCCSGSFKIHVDHENADQAREVMKQALGFGHEGG